MEEGARMRMSRREFSGLGLAGAAAGMLPRSLLRAQVAGARVGYCVIGLGRVADHFMRGVQAGSTSAITGLVSGHREKAERIAAQYGVPAGSIYSYEDMDRMRENKAIDAAYVALPNSMHAEYTIRSAKAGKHVLCEKPMATSVRDAKAMIAASEAAKVLLMIAYRLHYEPLTLKTIGLIRGGAVGQVQSIVSAFGFNQKLGEWRLDKALSGGGPLLDVGIYCLNATRYLTGEEPRKFAGFVSTVDKDARFATVEENTSWTTLFPSGIEASCATTYGAEMKGFFKVYGSKGWVGMDGLGYDGLRLVGSYKDASGETVKLDEASTEMDPMQFVRESDHFSECIRTGRTPSTAGDEGLRDMECMREIYRAAGVEALA
jgi:predicted dehydrogenase